MVILGIDPALSVTGYGAIEVKKSAFRLVEAGVIKTSARTPLPVRLDTIYDAVAGLISDTGAQVMVLEKLYAHYRHPVTSFLLGEARGVICLSCAKKNITLAEYAATRVKKAIVGKGLASKLQVQRMVMDLLGLSSPVKYTDVTDALALALAHYYIARLAFCDDQQYQR